MLGMSPSEVHARYDAGRARRADRGDDLEAPEREIRSARVEYLGVAEGAESFPDEVPRDASGLIVAPPEVVTDMAVSQMALEPANPHWLTLARQEDMRRAGNVESQNRAQQLFEHTQSLELRLQQQDAIMAMLAGPQVKNAMEELRTIRELCIAKDGEATVDAFMRRIGGSRVMMEHGRVIADNRGRNRGLIPVDAKPVPLMLPEDIGWFDPLPLLRLGVDTPPDQRLRSARKPRSRKAP